MDFASEFSLPGETAMERSWCPSELTKSSLDEVWNSAAEGQISSYGYGIWTIFAIWLWVNRPFVGYPIFTHTMFVESHPNFGCRAWAIFFWCPLCEPQKSWQMDAHPRKQEHLWPPNQVINPIPRSFWTAQKESERYKKVGGKTKILLWYIVTTGWGVWHVFSSVCQVTH